MEKQSIRRAYQVQRHNAKARDIPWGFSFDQWLEIWFESGHLYERGLKGDGYVMSRFNDEGGYVKGNVEIIKASQNSQQPQVKAKRKATVAARPVNWKRSDDHAHLTDRARHPRVRAVVCPDGIVYPSAALAADAHNRTRAAITHRCKTGWGGWHYEDT
jgi:hypothetical protein